MTPPTRTEAPTVPTTNLPAPGSFREFAGDVARALSICRRVPWLPAIELSLLLLVASSSRLAYVWDDDALASFVMFLSSVVWLGLIGWLGAQRLAFRAVMTGQPFGLGDVGRAISSQGWRFVKLAGLMVPAGAVVMAVTVVSVDDLTSESPEISTSGYVLTALVVAAIGVALTLVTPALAFETDKARVAWARGTERLRKHFRRARWHALLIPVFFAVTPTVTVAFEGALAQALALVAGSLTFIARGATVALHLRIRDLELAAMPPPRPVIH